MFERKLLVHDFLLRLGSKVCKTVGFRIVWKWIMGLSTYSAGNQYRGWLTLVLEIAHRLEAEAVVVWMVERKPLRVRWQYKKHACCMITIGYDPVEIVPKNRKRKRFQLAKKCLKKNLARHNHALTHLIYNRVYSPKKPNRKRPHFFLWFVWDPRN